MGLRACDFPTERVLPRTPSNYKNGFLAPFLFFSSDSSPSRVCYVGPARARGGTECSYGSAWFEPVRGAPRAAILGGIARVGFSHQRALPRPPFKFKISRAELEKLETSLSNSEQGARAKSKNDPRETEK